eukprot:Nk52_evm1s292 gene=Nk52_evmTU1s292
MVDFRSLLLGGVSGGCVYYIYHCRIWNAANHGEQLLVQTSRNMRLRSQREIEAEQLEKITSKRFSEIDHPFFIEQANEASSLHHNTGKEHPIGSALSSFKEKWNEGLINAHSVMVDTSGIRDKLTFPFQQYRTSAYNSLVQWVKDAKAGSNRSGSGAKSGAMEQQQAE